MCTNSMGFSRPHLIDAPPDPVAVQVLRSLKFKPLAHLLQQPARSMTKEEVLWEVREFGGGMERCGSVWGSAVR